MLEAKHKWQDADVLTEAAHMAITCKDRIKVVMLPEMRKGPVVHVQILKIAQYLGPSICYLGASFLHSICCCMIWSAMGRSPSQKQLLQGWRRHTMPFLQLAERSAIHCHLHCEQIPEGQCLQRRSLQTRLMHKHLPVLILYSSKAFKLLLMSIYHCTYSRIRAQCCCISFSHCHERTKWSQFLPQGSPRGFASCQVMQDFVHEANADLDREKYVSHWWQGSKPKAGTNWALFVYWRTAAGLFCLKISQ